MKKYKITFYGVLIGFSLSFLYSLFIYVSDQSWGDLAAIASFMVIFPSTLLITLVLQVSYILYYKSKNT